MLVLLLLLDVGVAVEVLVVFSGVVDEYKRVLWLVVVVVVVVVVVKDGNDDDDNVPRVVGTGAKAETAAMVAVNNNDTRLVFFMVQRVVHAH